MKPIFILAGQSNARRIGAQVVEQLDATFGTDNYILLKVHGSGATLTYARGPADDWLTDGELRTELQNSVITTLRNNPGSFVSGMLWLQGEADSHDGRNTTIYEQEFNALLGELRAGVINAFGTNMTGIEEMTTIISNLSDHAEMAGQYGNWDEIQNILESLGAESNLIRTFDPDLIAAQANIGPQAMFDDHVHYARGFRKALAEKFAATLEHVTANKAETVHGNAGDNIFDASLGTVHAIGGAGNDRYFIDHVFDRVSEQGGQGHDIVESVISIALRDHSQHLEDLYLLGEADISGTGNGLNNRIIGNDGANKIHGAWGNDTLDGGLGDDTLYGSNGDDLFRDTAGADHMHGGLGHDTYFIDHTGDRIEEWQGEGHDTVYSTLSFELRAHSQHIENLFLTGGEGLEGIGNGLNNRIIGNKGANALRGAWGDDTLDGGLGDDRLSGDTGDDSMSGGAGADVFEFSDDFGRDIIVDFDPDQAGEAIDLSAVGSITGYDDLVANHLRQGTDKVVIDETDMNGDKILLLDLSLDQLSADDFIF